MQRALPDPDQEDVQITLEGNVLTLSGERSFELPGDIDDKGIKAESKDGVLLVHIPRKQGAAAARPIAVQVQ